MADQNPSTAVQEQTVKKRKTIVNKNLHDILVSNIAETLEARRLEKEQKEKAEEFANHLREQEKEQALLDVLSEHQLYHHSIMRFKQSLETKLIPQQALEAMMMAKQANKSQAKIPQVVFNIENLLMFEFQNVHLILVCFGNKTVKVFESESGYFDHQFEFTQNLENQFKSQGGMNKDSSKQDITKISSPSPNKIHNKLSVHYIQPLISNEEAIRNFNARKKLRDKGIVYPEFPKWTHIDKTKEISNLQKQLKEQSQFKDNGSQQEQLKDTFYGNTNQDLVLVKEGLDETTTNFDFNNQTIDATAQSPEILKGNKSKFEQALKMEHQLNNNTTLDIKSPLVSPEVPPQQINSMNNSININNQSLLGSLQGKDQRADQEQTSERSSQQEENSTERREREEREAELEEQERKEQEAAGIFFHDYQWRKIERGLTNNKVKEYFNADYIWDEIESGLTIDKVKRQKQEMRSKIKPRHKQQSIDLEKSQIQFNNKTKLSKTFDGKKLSSRGQSAQNYSRVQSKFQTLDNTRDDLDSTKKSITLQQNLRNCPVQIDQKHRRTYTVQKYTFAEKQKMVFEMLQQRLNNKEITQEQMEEYKILIISKSYKDNLFNDFDCLLTMEMLQLIYPKESKAKIQNRWVQSKIKRKSEQEKQNWKPRSRSEINANVESKIDSKIKVGKKVAFKKTGDVILDLYASLGRMRKPILPDNNREEHQRYILGLDTVIAKETGRIKPDKQKGQEHDFGLDNSLFTSDIKQKEAKQKYQEYLQKEKMLKREYKDNINRIRADIQRDRNQFQNDMGIQNPLTDMKMLKQALGIKPSQLNEPPLGQENKWIDPEEALADSDKCLSQTVTLFCPEKKRRDLEVRDILQKRKLVQTKISLLKSKQTHWGEGVTELDSKLKKNVTNWRIQEFSSSNYSQGQKDQQLKLKSDYEIAKEEKEKNMEKELPMKKVKNIFLKTLEPNQDLNSMQNQSNAAANQRDTIENRLQNRLSQYGDDPAKEMIAKFEREREKLRIRTLDKQRVSSANQEKSKKKVKANNAYQVYPMCMDFYEKDNVAIFALNSREIQFHKLKKTGVRRKFNHIQSLCVHNMITKMSTGINFEAQNVQEDSKKPSFKSKDDEDSKGREILLLCLGVQSNQALKSEVVVFELDPKLDFEVLRSFRFTWPQEQITAIHYHAGCGLIVASFIGYMQIFDAKNVNQSVWSNGKLSKSSSGKSGGSRSISCIAYSEDLDIIAYAGVQGKIYVIDQSTKTKIGQIDGHKQEVVMLKFYDKERQLISISVNGQIGLWNAQKLSLIQFQRNTSMMTQKSISATSFYEPCGRILLATTKIFNFDLKIDQEILIQNRQQNAIARDYLREYRSQLIQQGKILELQHEPYSQDLQTIVSDSSAQMQQDEPLDSSRGKLNMFKRIAQRKEMTEHEFMQTAYEDRSIKDYMPAFKEYNGVVLPCKQSKLVGVILDSKLNLIYSIDCDLMIRVWNLLKGNCLRSYVIVTREDQIAEANQQVISEANPKQNLKKCQIVRADNQKEYMIIAFEGGEIQINKLKTGELIYNDHHVSAIKIENEIAQMKFFESQSKYWVAVGCWQGKVAFLSRPVVELGKQFLKYKNCGCSHANDVLTLDINSENQLVTGSIDNIICFWDSFSAQESKKIQLPETIAPTSTGRQIQYVRFPFKEKKLRNYILVIMNRGQCYIIETQTEKILKYHREENLKAELDESDECSHKDEVSDAELSDEFNISALEPTNIRSSIRMDDEPVIVGSANIANKRKTQIGQNNSPEHIRTMTNPSRASHYSQMNKTNAEKTVTHSHQKKGKFKDVYQIARASPHPAISIENEYLVSMTDNGKGRLHKISYDISKKQEPGAGIDMQLVGKFRAGSGKKYDTNLFFQVDLCTQIRKFFTSQVEGQIQIFSIPDCKKLVTLNQPKNRWQPFTDQQLIHGPNVVNFSATYNEQSVGSYPGEMKQIGAHKSQHVSHFGTPNMMDSNDFNQKKRNKKNQKMDKNKHATIDQDQSKVNLLLDVESQSNLKGLGKHTASRGERTLNVSTTMEDSKLNTSLNNPTSTQGHITISTNTGGVFGSIGKMKN